MRSALAVILFSTLTLSACRGMEKDSPPVHVVLNMDYQERFDPQEANSFFADGRAMRPVVPGTVARGMLKEDSRFYEGRNEGGGYVDRVPLPMTRELLLRGQERFNIFCSPCHGEAGDGEGIITTGGFGFTPAPTFHSDRMRQVADGYVYEVIANGIRTMPPYGHQVPVADRWAITAYIRALQRSQNARQEDVPASVRAEIGTQTTTSPGAIPGEQQPTGADTAAASVNPER